MKRAEYGPLWKNFCEIAMTAFKDWDPVAETLSAACTENYIFHEGGQDIGIATVHVDDLKTALLRNIAIKPELQRQGYGQTLLSTLGESLSGRFKAAELMSEPHNIPFYKAAGFNLQNSLPNSQDWRYMTKDF